MNWRFWYAWPSWVTEAVSGVAIQGGLWVYSPSHLWIARLVAGILVSGLYERFFDANGWSWRDVGQRAVGQMGFEVVRLAL